MACIDGAVVFDDHNLLAVGALVRSHPSVETKWEPGERPLDQRIFGAPRPIEVSSDGDVTVYFWSKNGDQECDTVMHFL